MKALVSRVLVKIRGRKGARCEDTHAQSACGGEGS